MVFWLVNVYDSATKDPPGYRPKIQNVGSEEIPEIDGDEIYSALAQMITGRAPGEDRITCEMLKMGGKDLLENVRMLLNACLKEGRIPKDGKMLRLYYYTRRGTDTTSVKYLESLSNQCKIHQTWEY